MCKGFCQEGFNEALLQSMNTNLSYHIYVPFNILQDFPPEYPYSTKDVPLLTFKFSLPNTFG